MARKFMRPIIPTLGVIVPVLGNSGAVYLGFWLRRLLPASSACDARKYRLEPRPIFGCQYFGCRAHMVKRPNVQPRSCATSRKTDRRAWLHLDLPFQVDNGLPADAHAIAVERAAEGAAAARQLARLERGFAEAFRPIGHQRAMRRAGHRIFGNALRRREETRHEIDAVRAGRGDDCGPAVDLAERHEIGLERGDLCRGLVDDEMIAGAQYLARRAA